MSACISCCSVVMLDEAFSNNCCELNIKEEEY